MPYTAKVLASIVNAISMIRVITKFIRPYVNSIPRKTPAHFRLEYYSYFYDYKTRLIKREIIILLPDTITTEFITERSVPGRKETEGKTREKTEFPVLKKDFDSFYRFLRKYRFDLIPEPYMHNSYDRIFYEWDTSIFLEFGKNDAEENCKMLEARNSMHMGIDGRDLQRLNLIIHRLMKLKKNS
jgi:hypothetical protein